MTGTEDATLHSPLHDRHVALGAKFSEFGGWLMPLQYSGVVAEHRAVRSAVGIFDVSHLGKLRIVGEGAADFVNTCITNDLTRIAPGQAQYTLLCNEAGGVVDDLISYLIGPDEVFLIPNASNTTTVGRAAGRRGTGRRPGDQRAPRPCRARRAGHELRRGALRRRPARGRWTTSASPGQPGAVST